jgi:hypothetical protein
VQAKRMGTKHRWYKRNGCFYYTEVNPTTDETKTTAAVLEKMTDRNKNVLVVKAHF